MRGRDPRCGRLHFSRLRRGFLAGVLSSTACGCWPSRLHRPRWGCRRRSPSRREFMRRRISPSPPTSGPSAPHPRSGAGVRLRLPPVRVAPGPGRRWSGQADPRRCTHRLSEPPRAPSAGATPGSAPADLPEQIESVFSYRVGSGSGEFREAVARVPLWLETPPRSATALPVILAVELDGAAVEAGTRIDPVVAGGQVEVRVLVDPSSLDRVHR